MFLNFSAFKGTEWTWVNQVLNKYYMRKFYRCEVRRQKSLYWGKFGGKSSSKIIKLFTIQKFILELSGNFLHFFECKLRLSGCRSHKYNVFLNFRSRVSLGICESVQIKWIDTYFNCFSFHCLFLIPLSHYQQGSSLIKPRQVESFSFWSLVVF